MTRFLILICSLLFYSISVKSQDYTFSFIKEIKSENEIATLADSIKKPLLITGNKVYSIGSNCISRLLDGSIDDRDNDGDSDNRLKNGDNDERNKGGATADRKKKGGLNKRNKKGNNNDRDKDGDNDKRDIDGDSDSRNVDGTVGEGTRCSVAKNGKLLLYTRQKISVKTSKIFFNQKFFSNKYFKIIQL